MKKYTLKEYRTHNHIKSVTAAKDLGISRQHLYDVENGNEFPSGKLIAKILSWSNGKVKIETLYRQP